MSQAPQIDENNNNTMPGSSEATTANGTHSPNGNGKQRERQDPLVKVQPPRREDLQPSYAQVIKPDTEDASQNGWYGNMVRGACRY